MIANARMYAVTPAIEARWQELLRLIAEEAGVVLAYEAYPAPQPLEHLWARADLGAVFMCGYPIALELGDVIPIAAPVPAFDWAEGKARYRSDLIVRADSPFQSLEATFGGRIGWTVDHSQSGFNALRHHLLPFRSPERPTLDRQSVGPLVTARRVLDEVIAGTIDIGPLDAYWHQLIARARPDLTEQIRVVDVTATVPMPAFVASSAMPADDVRRLKEAFMAVAKRPWFEALAADLLISGFAPVDGATYGETLARRDAALDAGYLIPS
jgi:ABC-type phosphate/phosphonate transport system substrate-binding protein